MGINSTPPPVPTRIPMVDDTKVATIPWVNWFTRLGRLYGYYQTIFAGGVAAAQELGLNFLAPFIVTDNPTTGTTDISLPAAAYSLQRGVAQANATGGDYSSVSVVFAVAFTAVPQVFLNPTNFPRGGNSPMTCYATNVTMAGFDVNLACAVPTGGGGDTIDNQIFVDWMAIGN